MFVVILKYVLFAKKPIPHPFDMIFGFYYFDINKIVVLISNHITEIFSPIASDNSIADVTLHELMHMYAHIKPNKYISFFRDELVLFYKTYFIKIFELRDEEDIDEYVHDFVKFLFLKVEMSESPSVMNIMKQLKTLRKFSKLKKDKFDEVVLDYGKLAKLFMINEPSQFYTKITPANRYILVSLYSSYKDIYGKIPDKGCVEELIHPSEVTCGITDIRVDSKIKKAINDLVS